MNIAGIAIILQMRERMEEMNRQMQSFVEYVRTEMLTRFQQAAPISARGHCADAQADGCRRRSRWWRQGAKKRSFKRIISKRQNLSGLKPGTLRIFYGCVKPASFHNLYSAEQSWSQVLTPAICGYS